MVKERDLRRVLEPREQQAIVMLMRNGDSEASRRHAAQLLRLGVDEFDALVASARRKVEQLRLRKAAEAVEGAGPRPVEVAALEAAERGGNGRAPVVARPRSGGRLERPPRLVRDDDEEAAVTTRTRTIAELALEALEEHGPMCQADLRRVIGARSSSMAQRVVPVFEASAQVERRGEVGKSPVWALVGDERPRVECEGDGAVVRAGEPVGSHVGAGQDGDGSPTAAASPVDTGADVGPAADQLEPSPPPVGGDGAGGESGGRCSPSRNGGDALEADPSADGSPSSETPPARSDGGDVRRVCDRCGEPIGPAAPFVGRADANDRRVWHEACSPDAVAPAPYDGGEGMRVMREQMAAAAQYLRRRYGGALPVEPVRAPSMRERYVEVLLALAERDAADDPVDLLERIERQLDRLDG